MKSEPEIVIVERRTLENARHAFQLFLTAYEDSRHTAGLDKAALFARAVVNELEEVMRDEK